MQFSQMGRHGPFRKLLPTVRTWDVPSEALPVRGPLPFDTPTEGLLLHPCANIPFLTGRGLGFCYIGHQGNPSEESDKDINGPLDPLQVPRSDEADICIKHAHTPSHRHPKSIMNGVFVLHCK